MPTQKSGFGLAFGNSILTIWMNIHSTKFTLEPLTSMSFNKEFELRAHQVLPFFWLRDVTPSHITSLDVTPSEVRSLEVLTSGHYIFGKLHLRADSPLEVTSSDVSPSGHYTFAKFLKTSEGEKSKGVISRR